MSSHPSWRPLPVSHHDVPKMLVSALFTPTPASYSIYVTDLANVWSENLDRRAILRRSLDEETTIDPSEDLDNMRAFLDKLRSALESNHPEHNLASLSLSVGDDANGDLVLHVTYILPKPLKPLKWPVHLKKQPPSSVATELVLPLVQAHHTHTQEFDALVAIVREKDAIITRLLDKFEVTGLGIESVWNHLTVPGKKKVTRSAAEAKVKGLAPFSEGSFRDRLNKDVAGQQTGGFSDVVENVFNGTGLKQGHDLDIGDLPQLNDWWTKLGSGSVTLTERKKETPKKATTPPPAQSKPAEDDDDFQVQSTPPHLMSARKRSPATRPTEFDDAETTGDEEPSQIPDSNPPEPALATPPKKSSRLGTIGKSKKPEPPPKSPTPPPPPVTRAHAGDDDGSDTASEAGEAAEPSPPPPSPPKPASSQPRKGGLGRIGGKAKAQATEAKATTPPPVESSQQTPKSAKGKLGRIGKKPAAAESSKDAPGDDGASRGRSRTPATEKMEVEEEKPRETSEERADRKRLELKKELDRKAAAGPAKKKRKF